MAQMYGGLATDQLYILGRQIARAYPLYNARTHREILNFGICRVTQRAKGLTDDRITGELRDLVLGDRLFVQETLDMMTRRGISSERKPKQCRVHRSLHRQPTAARFAFF
jgi:hypothetical protein